MTDQQKTIDMTPSWSEVTAMIRLFMKDDTPPEIEYELDRLGALADQLVRAHTEETK